MEISIIIPTYNEKENIKKLCLTILNIFKKDNLSGEIIVVDDNSPDGTGKILDELKIRYKNIKPLHRKCKKGLASAVIEGFNISKGDILGVMDADFSHPPEKISDLIKAIEEGYEISIGSRYVPGGKTMGWPVYRKIISWGATLISKILFNVPAKDPMSGYIFFNREILKGIKLNPKGFKINLEILVKTKSKKIKEIPIVFKNRKIGKSKLNLKEIKNYLVHCWKLIKF